MAEDVVQDIVVGGVGEYLKVAGVEGTRKLIEKS